MSVPEKTSLGRATLDGMFWTGAGMVFRLLLHVGVLAVLARLLTPTDFGIVGAAVLVISFGNTVASIGVGPALIQRGEITEKHRSTGFALSLAIGLLLGAVTFFGAGIVQRFFHVPQLGPVVEVLALTFPLAGIGVVSESSLIRDMRFRDLAVVEIVSYAIGYGCLAIPLATLGFGYWALVAAAFAQVGSRSLAVFALAPHRGGVRMDRAALRDLVYLGGGFSVARLANYFATQGDNLIVGRFLGPAALGLYGRAYQLLMVPAKVYSQVADRVVFPAMAKAQSEPLRLRRAYIRGVALGALAGMPITIGFVLLAPELVLVLLGPQWDELIEPFRILALAMFFRLGHKTAGTALRAKGRVYVYASLEVLYALLVVGGTWIGQFHGLVGVCVAVVIATAIYFVLVIVANAAAVDLPLREIVAVYRPGAILSVTIAAPVMLTIEAVRPIGSEFVTLLLSGTVALGVLLAALKCAPRETFGLHGVSFLSQLLESFRRRGWHST